MAQAVERDPVEPVRLGEVSPVARERRRLVRLAGRVADDEFRAGSPSERNRSAWASRWRPSALETNAGIGRSRLPAFDFGGPIWRAP